MPYSQRISRTNPSCLLFLIDQSGSMADSWGEESSTRKSEKVADIINRFLQALSIKCAREEGVRDYYHVGCIGYGLAVGSAFGGALTGREIIPLSEIANNPTRIEPRTKKVEDGAGGLVETTIKFPIWFDAVANGSTPMCQALSVAHGLLGNWVAQHRECFPPIVINVSDGDSTDGDPSSAAQTLRTLASSDGNILLFNAHISARRGQSALFPANEEALVDDHARLLFQMSDRLTDQMRATGNASNLNLMPGARGFVFNAQMEHLIQFIEIGTGTGAAANLR